MNCREALPLMHNYLDGDLPGSDAAPLKEHLLSCPGCHKHFRELEHTDAIVRSIPGIKAPDDLTAKIMLALPQRKARRRWLQWVGRHPAVSVASVFVFIMLGSYLSLWNQDKEMVVKGTDLDQVVIRGDTVYVPAGHTVKGNLLVERGRIEVDGDVQGNVVVIDGSYNLASTAHISGQIRQVDQALDWLWYKANQLFSLVAR